MKWSNCLFVLEKQLFISYGSSTHTYTDKLQYILLSNVQTPVVMDLSLVPGLAHMAWRVQQVSGNPPWQHCFCVRSLGQMVPGWAGTPGRAGFPRWTAADLRCGSGPMAGVRGAPSAQLTHAGCGVIHREGGLGVGYSKWVSEKGWFGHPRGPSSSSGPLVSWRICTACV